MTDHADSPFLVSKALKPWKPPSRVRGAANRAKRSVKNAYYNRKSTAGTQPDGQKLGEEPRRIPKNFDEELADAMADMERTTRKTGGKINSALLGGAAGLYGGMAVSAGKNTPDRRKTNEQLRAAKKAAVSKGAGRVFRVTGMGTSAARESEKRWPNFSPVLAGTAAAGGGALGYKIGEEDYKFKRGQKRKQIARYRKKAELKKSDPFLSKNLSQAQIDRRKKIQAGTSVTTATLGLGALGALGASKLGPKVIRTAAKSGKLRPVNERKLDSFSEKGEKTATRLSVTGAGVGGLGGYNFASYTRAEAKQRKKK